MSTSASHKRLLEDISALKEHEDDPCSWLEKAREITEGTPLKTISGTQLEQVLQLNDVFGSTVYAKVLSETPGENHYDYCMPSLITMQQQRRKANEGRRIPPNTTRLLEPTSTNAGISLAWVARQKGLESEIVMPERMDKIREHRVREEADVVTLAPWLTDEHYLPGVNEMLKHRKRKMADQNVKFRIPNHSEEDDTPNLFRRIGREVHQRLDETGIKIDIFVGAFGNGTTITGIGDELKEVHNVGLEVIGFGERASTCPTMIGATGIGDLRLKFREQLLAGGMPLEQLDGAEVKELFEGWNIGKSRRETIGISSAGALLVAKKLIESRRQALNVLVLFYDKADRYGNILVTEDDAKYQGGGRWTSGEELF